MTTEEIIVMQDRARHYTRRAMVWRDEGFEAMSVYYQRKSYEASSTAIKGLTEETNGND